MEAVPLAPEIIVPVADIVVAALPLVVLTKKWSTVSG